MVVEKPIVRLKREYPHWGAPEDSGAAPAALAGHALSRHQHRARRARSPRPRAPAPAPAPAAPDGHAAVAAAAPNGLWCADYKGEFLLGNHRYCYPLTITDFASRYLLACEALSTTQGALRLHRLRAGVSGVWAARRDPHRQRRAVRVGARALRPQQTRRVVAPPRHSARAHRAQAIPSKTAGTSACT